MATKGKWKIALSDVPNSIPIHQYIFEKTDFLVQTKKFSNYFSKDYVTCNLKLDFPSLQRDVKSGLDLFGSFPFDYLNKTKDYSYLSTSLNYNPNSIDKVSLDPHRGTLGSTIGSFKSTNQYLNNFLGKNTYNDTLSFVDRTEFSKFKSLGHFLDNLKRTMIRSRISVLDGGSKNTQDISYGWHNDELIFLNLRINIPIQSTKNYTIQILKNSNLKQSQITEFSLETGYAFAYDTNLYHRAHCKTLETTPRINLILGTSPWFDFDFENKIWLSNEFYGEIHPFEMLTDGLISENIGRK